MYYRDNVARSLELFDQLIALGRPGCVFSSSACLYAPVDGFAVDERSPLAPQSPYAQTKRMIEQMLEDLAAVTGLRAIMLRYFNPIGSDPDLGPGSTPASRRHVLGQLVLAARGQRTRSRHRHGLSDPGWHRHPRLHPCLGSRPGARRAVEGFDDVMARVGAPSMRSTWAPAPG